MVEKPEDAMVVKLGISDDMKEFFTSRVDDALKVITDLLPRLDRSFETEKLCNNAQSENYQKKCPHMQLCSFQRELLPCGLNASMDALSGLVPRCRDNQTHEYHTVEIVDNVTTLRCNHCDYLFTVCGRIVTKGGGSNEEDIGSATDLRG